MIRVRPRAAGLQSADAAMHTMLPTCPASSSRPSIWLQQRHKEREGLEKQLQAALHRLQATAQGAAALLASAPLEAAAAAGELEPVLQRHCVRVAGGPALDALLAVLQVGLGHALWQLLCSRGVASLEQCQHLVPQQCGLM